MSSGRAAETRREMAAALVRMLGELTAEKR
jgi:hypothetical protein